MALDDALLQRIRDAGRDLWSGVWRRVGLYAVLFLLLTHAGFFGTLWLLGDGWRAGAHRDAAVVAGRLLLPMAALLAACVMALGDSLHALVVPGPLLRSLGDLLLSPRVQPGALTLEGQLAAFASPQRLANAARIRDLPLILFLARIVLRVDVKSLLQAAETGLGREGLVREMERQARDCAALALRRLTVVVWVGLGCTLPLPFLVGRFLY
jgi:hypothetical protein